jgi:hypothetical protein
LSVSVLSEHNTFIACRNHSEIPLVRFQTTVRNAGDRYGAEEDAYRRLVGNTEGEETLTRARPNGRVILKWTIGN